MEQVVRDEMLEGRGFIFLRGLPVEGRSVLQNAIAQWGLATYIGRMLPQNAKGHLLEHVKFAGGDINAPTGRGYNSADALGFHCDSADAFSLMCLRGGKSGGEHRIVSSITVYNEMLKRRPDLAKELEFHFYRTRRGEIPQGEVPFHRQPVFSVTDGYFAARGASSTIKRAQKMAGVPKLTESSRRRSTSTRRWRASCRSTSTGTRATSRSCSTMSRCTPAPGTRTGPSPSASATCCGCGSTSTGPARFITRSPRTCRASSCPPARCSRPPST